MSAGRPLTDALRHLGSRLADFIAPILLFTAALSAGRLYFFVKYMDSYSGAGAGAIAGSFLRGVRFDLSTAAIMSVPFFLAIFLPGLSLSARLRRWLLALLFAWYALLLVYIFIDIQYYSFAQRHLTFELGNTWRDADVIVKIGLARYLPEFIGLLVFLAVFAVAFSLALRRKGPFPLARPGALAACLAADAAALLLVVALSVLMARGGVQMKPLSIKNAFSSDRIELGTLALNGVYSTFNTIYNRMEDASAELLDGRSFSNEIDVASLIVDSSREAGAPGYPLYRRFTYAEGERRPLNVVVFIMESWSARFVGSLGGPVDAAPFFSSLSGQGLLLSNCFANAQRSYEGLAATLGSVPSWKSMALDQGGLMYQTRLEPAASVLKRYGYSTIFVHGARPGSLGFDSLVARLGFQRHISRDDFEDLDRVDDGIWGVYDEPAFLRANEEFSRAGGPFFGVVYSLTSHTPYKVPSKEFEHFGKGVPHRDFLNSMRYSDFALGRFFEEARKSAYFKDTLFVVVADHAEGNSTGESIYDGYRIPCFLYGPGVAPAVYDGVASQLDMMPTLFDLMRVSAPFTSWGKSVFSKQGSRRAFLPRGDMFVWVDGRHMLLTDLSDALGLYDYRAAPGANILKAGQGAAEPMLDELLQYLRFSYDLILKNKVRPPSQSAPAGG